MPNTQTQVLPQFKSAPLMWFVIAAVVIALDQVTKGMAQAWLTLGGEPHVVTGFFNFQLRYNPGAAFSFLADHDGWQRWFFTILATVFSVVIVVWIVRSARKEGKFWELLGLSLVLGGALGNLYDRVVMGHVVDFIVWHYKEHEWPAFNIADAAICGGLGCFIVDMFKGNKEKDA